MKNKLTPLDKLFVGSFFSTTWAVFGLCVALLCSCASSHIKTTRQAPVPAVAAVPVSPELQAVRAAIAAPGKVVVNAPVVSVPAPVVSVPAPVVSVPATTVPVSVVERVKTAVASKPHKLIFWLLTTVLAVPLAWATKKYGLPYIKEFLAWVKSKNVISDLKSLATKAEVDVTKVESDIKSDVAKVEVEIKKL